MVPLALKGDRLLRGVFVLLLFASLPLQSSSSRSITHRSFLVNLACGFARSPCVLEKAVTDVTALDLFPRRLFFLDRILATFFSYFCIRLRSSEPMALPL